MIDYTQFQRPQRYIGNEINVVRKSHTKRHTICLAYPDLYEIGMSNLAVRILYHIFNQYDDIVCERVFAPAPDFGRYLTQTKTPLFSLETKTAVSSFDVLGIHAGCEINAANIMYILDMAGIPLRASDRRDGIVLGGGCANPQPFADFFDVFFMGEFEERAALFVEVLRMAASKQERLLALAKIPGFYVPSFFKTFFNGTRFDVTPCVSGISGTISRASVRDLDQSPFPDAWLTPHTSIIHDRIPVEIARGCTGGCNFCQARGMYVPYRQKKQETIVRQAITAWKSSGYEEISLLALSVSSFSGIELLLDELAAYFAPRRVNISLPSLRVDDALGALQARLPYIKNPSLTVAPEAATESLREHINKKLDLKKILSAIDMLRVSHIRTIKMYFMFGFPEETDDDLRALGAFISTVSRQSRLQVNVSINPFIPKPFSRWQHMPMCSYDELMRRRKILLAHAPANRLIKLDIHNIERSILEAVLARAGTEFGKVIYEAYRRGACFDADAKECNWDIWQSACAACGIDWRFYVEAATENHPWSFIV